MGRWHGSPSFHHEKLPSAIERYIKEVGRITGVLEGPLAKQEAEAGSDRPWLSGNKLSYAGIGSSPGCRLSAYTRSEIYLYVLRSEV